VLDNAKRPAEAAAFAERAVSVLQQDPLATHGELAVFQGNLAIMLMKCGRFREAESGFNSALDLHRSAPKETPELSTLLHQYSVLLNKTGRRKEAKKVNALSQAMWKRLAGSVPEAGTVDVNALRVGH
jgi:hypothetical protein